MKAVDTTFLVDYLTEDGEGPVAEFLEATENEPLYAPTLALNEVYRGVIFADGPGRLTTCPDDSSGSNGSRSPKRAREKPSPSNAS